VELECVWQSMVTFSSTTLTQSKCKPLLKVCSVAHIDSDDGDDDDDEIIIMDYERMDGD